MLESLERLCPREIFKTQGWTQKEECCGKANQYKKDDEKRAPERQRTMVPHGTRSSCVALQKIQYVGLYHIELAWSESADNLAGFASVSQSTF